ncbi:hypothetical protein BXY70_2808 [Roseovarius halotolerans]|uniref:Uncharacterized protein n=1 Tax=Roseovarius halotolerans TaxID=505353 RepID=A0A1X6ZFH7_9RHOB|nr:hypothetical protein [Roseovarius halotolerans]RKT30815.1 hypothetical protein BXY70_2808 [Roseovarius halotolerans]SLN49822.1 hypothetical protein ROH8110_02704 [Roseovarius halotolerans]
MPRLEHDDTPLPTRPRKGRSLLLIGLLLLGSALVYGEMAIRFAR